MRFLHYLPWVFLGALMILHGLAHTPAILGSWDLATFEDVSRQPNVLLTGAGDGMLILLGGIWLLAALSFVAAGIGVLRQAAWWPLGAATAIVLSVPMTMLWRDDAVVGLVINALLLGVLGVWFLIGMRRENRFA